MAGNIHDIIDATHDPVVSVFVTASVVAGQISVRHFAPILLLISFVVAPDPTQHARPRMGNDQPPAMIRVHRLPCSSTISGMMPGNGLVQLPGFVAIAPGNGHIMIPPVSVCHQVSTIGHLLVADLLVVPHPGFRIDAFTNRAQQPQAGQIVFVHVFVAPFDEGSNRGGSRVEDRHFDACSTISQKRSSAGKLGAPSYISDGRSGRQRAVNNVAVTRDPTAIGSTPENIIVAMIKHPLERLLGVKVVARRGVLDAFGFPRRATGIQNEQWAFRYPAVRRDNRRHACSTSSCHQSRGPPAS